MMFVGLWLPGVLFVWGGVHAGSFRFLTELVVFF
jgi:hypothetical protein